jgi:hypothetical protein
MPVPPESITPGKCFATKGNQVRRVLTTADGQVSYEARAPKMIKGRWPKRSTVSVEKFAADGAREGPCHFDPDFEPLSQP